MAKNDFGKKNIFTDLSGAKQRCKTVAEFCSLFHARVLVTFP